MKIIGIIPSRYNSSRFPGKPLVNIRGKSMIRRVYEQSCKAMCLSEVVVATDDIRIENHVKEFGGKVVMTSPVHNTGTERCAEVVKNRANEFDIAINIQGDEPFIQPAQIELVANCFLAEDIMIATLAKKMENLDELRDPNRPKVIMNLRHEAIYFTRAAVPHYLRIPLKEWTAQHVYYKHIGIYAYRADVLQKIVTLTPTPLETAESLEQLRWLEHGYKIHVGITESDSFAIDTPEDLMRHNV